MFTANYRENESVPMRLVEITVRVYTFRFNSFKLIAKTIKMVHIYETYFNFMLKILEAFIF